MVTATKVRPKEGKADIQRIRITTYDDVGLTDLYIKWKSVAFMPWEKMRKLFPKDIAEHLDTDPDYALEQFAQHLIVDWNIPDEDDNILPLPKDDNQSIRKAPTVVAARFKREVEADIAKISF